jgi:aspartate kinase
MGLVIQKYGGSSLANTEALNAVANSIVSRFKQGDTLVVVVSAMGKTTEDLLRKAREVSQTPCQRELDMLVTAGERISMALLSMAIQAAGVEAISFTGSQSGIMTTNDHQEARIIEVRPQRIQEALASGKIVIVAGFQGVSLEREVTTLGRGGSDTSAVALAAALAADACEIYSDVDGVYSSDPNLCAQAKHLPSLDYKEMKTMALYGAQVLNADAIAFAQRAGIEIRARKTGEGRRESVVRARGDGKPAFVAVVGLKQVTRCLGLASGRSLEQTFVGTSGARMIAAHLSGQDVELWLDRTNIPGGASDTLHAIAKAQDLNAYDCSLLTLLGLTPDRRISALQEARMLFKEASIDLMATRVVDEGINFLVGSDDFEKGTTLLHAHFVEKT